MKPETITGSILAFSQLASTLIHHNPLRHPAEM